MEWYRNEFTLIINRSCLKFEEKTCFFKGLICFRFLNMFLRGLTPFSNLDRLTDVFVKKNDLRYYKQYVLVEI